MYGMEKNPVIKTSSRDSMLVKACNFAVEQRRKELKQMKNEILYSKVLNEWKSYTQLSLSEVTELQKIDTELKIIDNIMIRTQQVFQKMGGQIKMEIRRSDIPVEYYESLNEVDEN